MHVTQLAEHSCPCCGKIIDAASVLGEEKVTPRPGDISFCLYCGQLLTFDDELVPKEATEAVLDDLDDEDRKTFARMRKAQRDVAGFTINWFDAGFSAKNNPEPAFPNGKRLNVPFSDERPSCVVALPYPARRVGWHAVECRWCGEKVLIATSGTVEDMRSIRLACRMQTH